MAEHKDAATTTGRGTVHVFVPRTDLDTLNKVTGVVLGKLGCGQCHSGFDIRFNQERIFVLNEQGAVQFGG
jgi:hypothetical protein